MIHTLPDILKLPPITHSGPGTIRHLPLECEAFGARGILVHGRSLEQRGALSTIVGAFSDTMSVKLYCHEGGEPTLDQLEALLAEAREFKPDWVASVGGGSVVDVAKSCAGLLEASRPAVAYHDGEELPPSRIPFFAVPTTAGTGSEATAVSVLTSVDSPSLTATSTV